MFHSSEDVSSLYLVESRKVGLPLFEDIGKRPVRISVIICTRNRAEQLRHVLEAATRLSAPGDAEWELLIVNNGSTDHTSEVIAEFQARLPVREIFEGVAGLSNARNRGVAEASGDYICWTDDDVEIDPEWLAAYAEAFRRHPEASVFGGRIVPVLQGNTPAWFATHRGQLGHLLAERDLGAAETRLTVEGDRLPFGANFAVRTAEQRRHLYDPGLGVGPGQRRLGEETQVITGILLEGGAGVWTPGAAVRHIIPESRQTEAYVLAYQESAGQSAAYLSADGKLSRRRIFGVPVWLLRRMMESRILSAIHGLFGRSGSWLKYWQEYGYFKGGVDYYLSQRQRAGAG